MNRYNWKLLLLASTLFVIQPLRGQQGLGNVMTMGFGDVAAIKQKAEAGDAKAQVVLGDTLGGNWHPAEALQWYRKAADQGNVEAAYKIGHALLFGAVGIPKEQTVQANPVEALRWTFWAATNRHANACWDMAKALQQGLGVNTNLVEAYAWVQLFAETGPGSIVGRVELNTLALKLDTASLQQAQRLVARFKAGDWNRPVAQVGLKLNGITFGAKTPLAVINGKTFAEGESGKIPIKPVPVTLKCLKIEKDLVTVSVDGENAPRMLRLNDR
jgi:hypothetical protein